MISEHVLEAFVKFNDMFNKIPKEGNFIKYDTIIIMNNKGSMVIRDGIHYIALINPNYINSIYIIDKDSETTSPYKNDINILKSITTKYNKTLVPLPWDKFMKFVRGGTQEITGEIMNRMKSFIDESKKSLLKMMVEAKAKNLNEEYESLKKLYAEKYMAEENEVHPIFKKGDKVKINKEGFDGLTGIVRIQSTNGNTWVDVIDEERKSGIFTPTEISKVDQEEMIGENLDDDAERQEEDFERGEIDREVDAYGKNSEFVVVDCPFNRSHYGQLIGKRYPMDGEIPPYAILQKIKIGEETPIIEESQELNEMGRNRQTGELTGNDRAIEDFVSGEKRTRAFSRHLKIEPKGDGTVLINYWTNIAYNPRTNENVIFINKDKYSVTTSKIQNQIRRMASRGGAEVNEVSEKELNDIIDGTLPLSTVMNRMNKFVNRESLIKEIKNEIKKLKEDSPMGAIEVEFYKDGEDYYMRQGKTNTNIDNLSLSTIKSLLNKLKITVEPKDEADAKKMLKAKIKADYAPDKPPADLQITSGKTKLNKESVTKPEAPKVKEPVYTDNTDDIKMKDKKPSDMEFDKICIKASFNGKERVLSYASSKEDAVERIKIYKDILDDYEDIWYESKNKKGEVIKEADMTNAELANDQKRKFTKNWTVIVYDKDNKEIDSWEIKDRSEGEASREAEADIRNIPDAEDWSLMPKEINESLTEKKNFIQDIKKGGLHKALGYGKDEKIPEGIIQQIIDKEEGSTVKVKGKEIKITGKLKKQANLAKTFKKIRKKK